jgi:hypothetical protein
MVAKINVEERNGYILTQAFSNITSLGEIGGLSPWDYILSKISINPKEIIY